MTQEERPVLRALPGQEHEAGELSEVLDITAFQQRLSRIRERNREILQRAPEEWARRVNDIQDAIRAQRKELEDTLLEQMLEEETSMLTRLEDIERNLRNMIRLYRQLMEERNSMVTGLQNLHKWIREMEQKQHRHPHKDHRVDLAQKSFVEYLSKQAWMFDNSSGWDLEEAPRRRKSSAARD
jgi:hypothetical protein